MKGGGSAGEIIVIVIVIFVVVRGGSSGDIFSLFMRHSDSAMATHMTALLSASRYLRYHHFMVS